MNCSYLIFKAVKFPDTSLYIESSMISKARSLENKIATPLAWEVKLAKLALPPHSDLTTGSISLASLVSESIIILAFFFFRAWIIFALLGFFPIEFGLKDNNLSFEAEVIQVLLESFSFIEKEICCWFFSPKMFWAQTYYNKIQYNYNT